MNVNSKLTVTLVIFMVVFSCQRDKFKGLEKSISYLEQKNIDHCISRIIIIPNAGCNGCITIAENFYKQHFHRKDLFFIFTNISSLKLLKLKLNIDLAAQENTYIDAENRFSQHRNAMYPVSILYNCKSRKIASVEFQKPGNNVFSKLH